MKGLVFAFLALLVFAFGAPYSSACDTFGGGFGAVQSFGGYGFGVQAVAVQAVPVVQQRVVVQRQAVAQKQAFGVANVARARAVNVRSRGVAVASTSTRCGIFGCRTVSRSVVR